MEKIGKYEILGEIGRGGMGIVYKALDPFIGREVAIKVISEGALDSPETKERFYREAQSAGKLSHENITIVFELGEAEGKPYIVMEYLPGSDLRSIINKKRSLSLVQKLDYARQICKGLSYSHSKDIIHRDIKPENIRILDGGKLKVMDFGIAKAVASTMTSTGTVVGTAYYMSPEQIKGEEVDKRSDIFSFGVLFHELLAYKKPFAGDSIASVTYNIVHEEPEKLSIEGCKFFGELQKIVSKCLEKKPVNRYDDFSKVINDIDTIINKENRQMPAVEEDEQLRTITSSSEPIGTLPNPAKKLSLRALLFVLSFIAIASIFGNWYFFNEKDNPDQVNFHEQADAVKQRMFALKAQAELVNAESLATELFQMASAYKQRGDKELADANFVMAKQFYNSAIDKFGESIKEAKRNAGLNELELVKLSENVDFAKNEMLKAKSRAQRAGAQIKAKNVFDNASMKQQEGDNSYARGNRENLGIALKAYSNAKDSYIKALQDANAMDVGSSTESPKKVADEARIRMVNAKQLVAGDKNEKRLEPNYQRGIQEESAGEGQFISGDFKSAAISFQTAQNLYVEADKNITSLLKNRADEARVSMKSAKEKVDKTGAEHEAYKQALRIEDEGNNSYNENDFASAKELFQNARLLFEQVAPTKEGEIVSENSSSETAQQAIQGLISKYKEVLENRDIQGLRTLFVNFTIFQEKKWSDMFESAKDLRVNIAIENTDLSDANPKADLLVRIVYLDNKNRERQTSNAYTWILEQRNGEWAISHSIAR